MPYVNVRMWIFLCTLHLNKCVSIESWDIFLLAYTSKGVPCVNVLMRLFRYTVHLSKCVSIESWDNFLAACPSKGVKCVDACDCFSAQCIWANVCNWVPRYFLRSLSYQRCDMCQCNHVIASLRSASESEQTCVNWVMRYFLRSVCHRVMLLCDCSSAQSICNVSITCACKSWNVWCSHYTFQQLLLVF